MRITSAHHGAGFCLKLVGDLVKESVPVFRGEVSKLEAEPPATLSLDMAEVSYIDSSGLVALILVHKTWKKRGEAICLVSLSPRVKEFCQPLGSSAPFSTSNRRTNQREILNARADRRTLTEKCS